MRRSARGLSTLLLTLLAESPVEAQSPLGGEFQVNSYTNDDQAQPTVAMDADGDFVVVWQSVEDGSGYGIFAQRWTSSGIASGAEFQVNTVTVGNQTFPDAGMDGGGSFVIGWLDARNSGDVFVKRYDSAGVPQGGEVLVNSAFTGGSQNPPALATSDDGGFVVAWHSNLQDGSGNGVFAQRFDSAGAFQGVLFQVNTYTEANQEIPTAAMDADGDFVIAWRSFEQDGTGHGVFGQRFDSGGVAQAGEFQVNTVTAGSEYGASVAMDDDGDFAIAWRAPAHQDGSGTGISLQRFDPTGARLATEFRVNTHTMGNQTAPAAAMRSNGDFLIAWGGTSADDPEGIAARFFGAAGGAHAAQAQVNSFLTNNQQVPAAAMDADGDFVVVWQSSGQDGDSSGVFAQRYRRPGILDIDGNGAVGALTDGLLVLRFLFGFSGGVLVTGAFDTIGCTRCDAASIGAYLAALTVLDVDGNGSPDPLTDGLLVLRFLFGFSGAVLISGAVDSDDCSRCDAGMIADYIAPLT
jgi:hypothetical protein